MKFFVHPPCLSEGSIGDDSIIQNFEQLFTQKYNGDYELIILKIKRKKV